MKKFASVMAASALIMAALHAYNPPVGNENLFEYSSPAVLSGKLSVTGGALFSAGPDSLIVNPALTAGEQRTALNVGYTFLYSGNDQNEHQIGSSFQTGILIPFKLYIFSGFVDGNFASFDEMYLGSNINIKAGLAKEITDKLDVGASLSGGINWGYGFDWALAGNLGFNYTYGDLAFMKNFRYGASLLNLGKGYLNYSNRNKYGIAYDEEAPASLSMFPTYVTLKVGAAASLFKNDLMDLGIALDLTTPCFQNLIVDLGVQFALKDMLVLSIGEKINIAETVNGHNNFVPGISLSFKFDFSVKNNEYLARNDWSQSEMTVSAGYKNLYGSVHAISAAADLSLGMQDTTAPKIILTGFDDEE
ncbi:MAG: hypothetical protein IJ688_05925 [Treponema sp.]|nr:hypothetical protein [Treponema sp.]